MPQRVSISAATLPTPPTPTTATLFSRIFLYAAQGGKPCRSGGGVEGYGFMV